MGETAGTGTNLSNYESSIACSGASTVSSSNAGPLALGPLAAGAVVDCTITNKRKPQVKVTKQLQPALGDPGKFNLQINGATEQPDAGDGGTTGYVNVEVGSNPTVGETAGTGTNLSNYESSIACSGASTVSSSNAGPLALGPLAAGAVVDCTITNKRKPQVKVTKQLQPALGDPGKFNLQINGATEQPDAGDGGTTGYVNVEVGSNPTVGETAGTGTNLSNYECSIACSGASTVSSSNAGPLALGPLAAGAVVDCTITNKRKPQVKVTKQLQPALGDPGKFNLQINGATEQPDAGDGGTTGYVNVEVGSNPTVGETAGTGTNLSNYESSIACSGASTVSSSNAGPLALGPLAAGAVVDCTITNKRKPQVKVTKQLQPALGDPGKFNLQINGATEQPDAGDGGTTGYVNVEVGSNPTVGETAGTGTDLSNYESSIACSGASTVSSSNAGPLALGPLAAGAVVDCTITNKRKPQVKVTKQLQPALGDPGKFNLQINGATEQPDAGDGGTTGYVNVEVGSNPTVGETAGTGTNLSNYESSIACSGASTVSSSNAGPLALGPLAAGAVVDCTITNKRKPQVKVTKQLQPALGDPGKFNLQINGATEQPDAGDGGTTGYVNVEVGSNPTVGETAGTGTNLSNYESSIACSGASTVSSSNAGPLALGPLAAGAVVDCTITNKRKPQVKVTKQLQPALGDPGKFNLQINGATEQPDAGDGGTTGYVNVEVGSNPTVGETAGTGTNLSNYESSIACSGASTVSSSNAGPLALGPLAAGAVVDCTITNKRKPQVKVTKQLQPALGDPGKFNLQINGATEQPDAGDGGTTGYVNVEVGSNPTVGETAGTGTNLSNYESSIACSGASTVSSSNAGPLALGPLAAGAVVDCTITNKRKPQVKVTKQLQPALGDPGKFNLQINGATEQPDAGDGGTTGYVNVEVGSNPTVGETAGTGTNLSNYESSIACSGASTVSSSNAGPLRARAAGRGRGRRLHDHQQAQAAGEGDQAAAAGARRPGQVQPADQRRHRAAGRRRRRHHRLRQRRGRLQPDRGRDRGHGHQPQQLRELDRLLRRQHGLLQQCGAARARAAGRGRGRRLHDHQQAQAAGEGDQAAAAGARRPGQVQPADQRRHRAAGRRRRRHHRLRQRRGRLQPDRGRDRGHGHQPQQLRELDRLLRRQHGLLQQCGAARARAAGRGRGRRLHDHQQAQAAGEGDQEAGACG